MKSAALLRETVREYVRSQRRTADCNDTASTVECHILTELHRVERITQQELANRLMLDKGWISRGVDRLMQADLVERLPDANDKRRVQLRLLPAGRARAIALETRLNIHAASLLDQLSPEQDSQLARLLEQVLVSLDRACCPAHAPCTASLIQYRRAEPSDWPKIRQLLENASLPTEDAADHLDQFIVGTDATGLVAACGFERYGVDALLRSFVVAPQVRGRGHGSTLIKYALQDAATHGITCVYLLTETAAPFFERHGFYATQRKDAPTAIRKTREYKHLCPASAQLLARSISQIDNSLC